MSVIPAGFFYYAISNSRLFTIHWLARFFKKFSWTSYLALQEFLDLCGKKNHLMSVFSIGIIVDGTIHFMSQHPRDRRLHNASPENAVRKAFARTGRAPLSATAIPALGFGVFAFSSFQPNWPLAIWYLHLLFWRW
ncbi:MAG: hypothetical protein OXE85_07990 [Roseovarius sp.]|nr:hypothetical protein [Roseovarius sp.]